MSDVREAFLASLTYEPDGFQVRAMNSIDADASVLVAAPTGSGKTLIAEYGTIPWVTCFLHNTHKGFIKSEIS